MRAEPGSNDAAPRVLFLGRMYAGHRTRFLNLIEHSRHDLRIRPTYRPVSGWIDDGLIERVPIIPSALKGRARAVLEAAAISALPRPAVIWTAITEVAVPHLWADIGPLRRPLVLDLDWTLEQQEQLAPLYFHRAPKRGVSYAVARLMERVFWSRVSVFTPWSTWAADSLRRHGVHDDRIRVLPPGVDLDHWRPPVHRNGDKDAKLKLLFVGGDFERKGGRTLLDVFSSRFADRCELDIVTLDPIEPRPGVRIHRAEPNSPLLRELYGRADLFVLPSRAECFGIATVEAMASGLPAIVCDVGGARDIVWDGVTGWLIEPTGQALAQALDRALTSRYQLPQMGLWARHSAEERFDGKRNDAALVDLLVEEADAFRYRSNERRPQEA